ncbi:MAG: hypothetical protein ABI624_25165 [Casimicrobiaceae bacterium]
MGLLNAIAIALIALAGIIGAWVGWFALQSYVFDACERFGCAGGLMFAFTVSAEGGTVAAVAAVVAAGLLTWIRTRFPAGAYVRTLLGALVLAPVLRSLPKWPVPDALLFPAWFAACLIVFLIALGVQRRTPGR